MSIVDTIIKEFEEAKDLREFVRACDSEGVYRDELQEDAGGFSGDISEGSEKQLGQAALNDAVAQARDAAFERLNLTQHEVDQEDERQLVESE